MSKAVPLRASSSFAAEFVVNGYEVVMSRAVSLAGRDASLQATLSFAFQARVLQFFRNEPQDILADLLGIDGRRNRLHCGRAGRVEQERPRKRRPRRRESDQ